MRIDHLVVNIEEKYQKDSEYVNQIRSNGFCYKPKWGKSTKGFKVSNIWIGNEYFELVNILNKDGGGWKKDWVKLYNKGYRGLVCLMIDVENIDYEYDRLIKENVDISRPEYLKFKWFFKLLTRKMPWRNSYINYFQKIPFQMGFQQMKDEKALNFMRSYMVPNSIDKGILGINKIIINGEFQSSDFNIIQKIFINAKLEKNKIFVNLKNNQTLIFIKNDEFFIEVFTKRERKNINSNFTKIENIYIY